MGFYGNLSNTKKSPFKFDAVYPNRKAMDDAAGSDGVYIGRNVLVDYNFIPDNELAQIEEKFSNFKIGYKIFRADGTVSFHTGNSIISPVFEVASEIEEEPVAENTENPSESEDTEELIIDHSSNTIHVDDYILVRSQCEYKTVLKQAFNPNQGNNSFPGQDVVSEKVSEDVISPEIWRCIGQVSENDKTAVFVKSYEDPSKDTYQNNYRIDQENYVDVGRGWDSTVWQKVGAAINDGESNDEEVSGNDWAVRYIMIANLNTITPTFDVTYDAPTETPLVPHFDVDSSNLYYNIHMQPQWGIRLKGAANAAKAYTLDTTDYPSDVNGPFIVDSNLDTGKLRSKILERKLDEQGNEYYAISDYIDYYNQGRLNLYEDTIYHSPLAIYFNKTGFDPEQVSDPLREVSASALNAIARQNPDTGEWILEDSIKLRPSGLSTNEYNHLTEKAVGGYGVDNALKVPDTYELSIMLPSIGTTISKIWDIIYGVASDGSQKDSLGRDLWHSKTKQFARPRVEENGVVKDKGLYLRNIDMEWDSLKGIRNVDRNGTGYNRVNLDSLAGSINSIHDVLGMIIRDYAALNDGNFEDGYSPESWDPTKIYFYNNQYYMKHKTYTYHTYDDDAETRKLQKWKETAVFDLATIGNIYREDWQEFPRSLKPNGERYINHIKLNNADEYIEGATYYEVSPANGADLSYNYQANKYYSWDNVAKAYTIDTNDNPKENQQVPTTDDNNMFNETYYYKITEEEVVNEEEGEENNDSEPTSTLVQHIVKVPGAFYIPKKYFLRYSIGTGNNQSYFFYSCSEATISAAIEACGLSATSEYDFFNSKDIESNQGSSDNDQPVYQKVYRRDPVTQQPIPIMLREDLPSNSPGTDTARYKIEDGKLYLLNNDLELINSETGIIDSDNIITENGNIVGYNSYLYRIETGGQVEEYYTPWQIFEKGYSYPTKIQGENTVEVYDKAYQYDLQIIEKVVNYKLKADAEPVNLIEYDENKNYYYVNDNNFDQLFSITKDQLANSVMGWEILERTTNGLSETKANAINNSVTFYEIQLEPVRAMFYLPTLQEGYYYQEGGNWYREISTNLNSKQIKRTPDDENGDFYLTTLTYTRPSPEPKLWVPNKYYVVNDDGDFVLSDTYDASAVYYENTGDYVISDTQNRYQRGAEWNSETVPEGITIGYRREQWEAKPLLGFSSNINTLYGLLLQLNKVLDNGDLLTRDSNTIAGNLNKMRDAIIEFNNRTGCFVSVKTDDNNVINASGNSLLTIKGDDWIQTSIKDGNLFIEHKYQKSESELGIDLTIVPRLSKGLGEEFSIDDLVSIDSTGHIVNVKNKINMPNLMSQEIVTSEENRVVNSLTKNSKNLKVTYIPITNLKISDGNNYNGDEEDNGINLKSTDNLGTALHKLENQFEEVENRLNKIEENNPIIQFIGSWNNNGNFYQNSYYLSDYNKAPKYENYIGNQYRYRNSKEFYMNATTFFPRIFSFKSWDDKNDSEEVISSYLYSRPDNTNITKHESEYLNNQHVDILGNNNLCSLYRYPIVQNNGNPYFSYKPTEWHGAGDGGIFVHKTGYYRIEGSLDFLIGLHIIDVIVEIYKFRPHVKQSTAVIGSSSQDVYLDTLSWKSYQNFMCYKDFDSDNTKKVSALAKNFRWANINGGSTYYDRQMVDNNVGGATWNFGTYISPSFEDIRNNLWFSKSTNVSYYKEQPHSYIPNDGYYDSLIDGKLVHSNKNTVSVSQGDGTPVSRILSKKTSCYSAIGSENGADGRPLTVNTGSKIVKLNKGDVIYLTFRGHYRATDSTLYDFIQAYGTENSYLSFELIKLDEEEN